MSSRPLAVTLIAVVLIVAGSVGFVYHFSGLNFHHLVSNDTLWIELIRILAIVAGVFMLRGRNWARWLAIAWIAFHVVISFWHSWAQVGMHVLVLVVFAFFLFRPAATRYFQTSLAGAP